MQTGTGKTAEDYEHHRIAAGEQQQDRRPHPGKEFLERCAHQPQALRRLKRDERRAQADINREHATDPDDGTEYVEREGERGHERLPVRGTIKRYYSGYTLAYASYGKEGLSRWREPPPSNGCQWHEAPDGILDAGLSLSEQSGSE